MGKNKNGRKCTKIEDDHRETMENLEAATFLNEFYVNAGPSLAQKQNKKWEKQKSQIELTKTFSFT